MADITVTPDTFELALTQQAVKTVCSFPGISRKPSQVFSDEPSDKAVLIEDAASGYPVLIKLFTFDPRTLIFELPGVSEADKLTVMAFYETHKDIPFPWYNYQDKTWYEVVFVNKPRCRLDGRGDLWRITLNLRQSTP